MTSRFVTRGEFSPPPPNKKNSEIWGGAPTQVPKPKIPLLLLLCKYSFKIVVGIGNELVAPNLMADQCLDGERLSKLFTQKTVWLIPNVEVLTEK